MPNYPGKYQNFITSTYCALNSTAQSSSYHYPIPIQKVINVIQSSQIIHKIPQSPQIRHDDFD